ncbi:response regulator [Paraliomyxa miuraensis]|uniref:response regulator n=1 Tax=Paraliomyxa miuraensis TaxID=376150 RepID=UPI00225A86C2|nr:response regulator [Paraliomyxa miuraensis]MCX4241238.1 response regulator [Paraliomyxa miuraensis]
MKRPGRVLVVDDEPFYRTMLAEELAKDGWSVEAVETRTAALDALAREPWSVVLVDQKLRGPKGPDSGLELIAEVRRAQPEARSIVVTAYASPNAVERAYRDGAYDFVEKTESFTALLRIKVRNAMESIRSRWLELARSEETSPTLARLLSDSRTEHHAARKGRLLEDLLELLLSTVPGFVVVARENGTDEEFDLVVRNESSDPFWSKESPYILVECKNWSSRVGPDELDRFTNKLGRRYDRAKLGLFVAANGFTQGFETTRRTGRTNNVLVVPVGAPDLDELVAAPNVGETLKALHQRATVGTD